MVMVLYLKKEAWLSVSNDIKAIETEYDGHRFRSRLEARWAVFFNAVGLTYEYEIEGFEMDGTRYLPDFYIPNLNRWFEIKGKPLSLGEIKKCEEFCRRLDNENIKFSVLIGSPNLCAVRIGDFSGILEYVWEWPSEKYPDNYRIQAPKELIEERILFSSVYEGVMGCSCQVRTGSRCCCYCSRKSKI